MEEQSNYDKLLKELEAEVKEQKKELKLLGIEQASDFLTSLRKDMAEIDLLQGRQRKVRIDETKVMLVEKLLNKSSFKMMLPDDHFETFKEELLEIHSFN